MSPEEVLVELEKALRETTRIRRRLMRLQKHPLPDVYWSVSFRCLETVRALEYALQADKSMLLGNTKTS